MDIQDWYQNEKQKDALHWEIFKYCRPRSIALLGEKKKDRFINIGKFGKFRQELNAKFNQDNPYYDFYATVEYLAKTNQTSREEFKEMIDQGKTHKEIAEKLGTHEKVIEDKHNKLENNKLEKTVKVPANYKDHFYKYLYDAPGYDLVFDIDGDDAINKKKDISKEEINKEYSRKQIIDEAYKEAEKIVDYLEKHNAPYSVRFSGGKGFHISIQREHIKQYIENNNYPHTAGLFAEFIQDKTNAKIDYKIYSKKRIYRVPYTMHTETNLICMPLTKQQFKDFKLKYASPDYIKNNINLKNRGLCTRQGKANKIIKKFREWKKQ
ncbi:MAG: hypothetical protein ABEI78_00600, partial [Candidatus Nanohaloarchaea archaeon]